MIMHLCAAEIFVGRDFAGRRFQQRRPRQKHFRLAAHRDDIIGEPGLIGAACCRRSMHHGDYRTTGGGKTRQIRESPPARYEHLRLAHQIGAGAFNQLHIRKLVLKGQGLTAQRLVNAHGRRSAALDAAVRGGDDAPDAGDESNAANSTAAGNIPVAVVIMHFVAAERRQFHEWRASIENEREALARQQLPPLFKFRLGPRGRLDDLGFKRTEALNQAQMIGAVFRVALTTWVDLALKNGHRFLEFP